MAMLPAQLKADKFYSVEIQYLGLPRLNGEKLILKVPSDMGGQHSNLEDRIRETEEMYNIGLGMVSDREEIYDIRHLVAASLLQYAKLLKTIRDYPQHFTKYLGD